MPVPIAELFVTVGADISAAVSGLNSVGTSVHKMGRQITSAGRELTTAITLPVVGAGTAIFKVGTEFEHAFTQVRKTVDNTDLDDLRNQLIDLSTSIEGGAKSAPELAGIAAVAGQLGIEGADNIAKFTKVIAGLGVTTGLPTEQLAEDAGRFRALTGISIDSIENFGSALTDLGNRMGGTEGDILSLSRRLAGTLTALGVSPQDILGISGALAEVGIQAEEGGTAISRFFVEMTDAAAGTNAATEETSKKMRALQDSILGLSGSLEVAVLRQKEFGRNTPASVVKANELAIQKYQRDLVTANSNLSEVSKTSAGTTLTLEGLANVTGMSQDAFASLVKTDPARAFMAVIKGLQNVAAAEGPSGVVRTLDELNIQEARLRETLLDLSAPNDALERGVRIANEAWAANTALQVEVAKSMQDTNNQLDLMRNRLESGILKDWDDFKTRIQGVVDFINTEAIPIFGRLGEQWKALSPEQKDFILQAFGMAAAIGPVVFAVGTLITAIGLLTNPIGWVITAIALLAAAWAFNVGDIQGKIHTLERAMQNLHDQLAANFQAAAAQARANFAQIVAIAGAAANAIGRFFNEVLAAKLLEFQNFIRDKIMGAFIGLLKFLQSIGITTLPGGTDVAGVIANTEAARAAAAGAAAPADVTVNINNPTVPNAAIGEQFAQQVRDAVIQAMIDSAGEARLIPPSPAVPGAIPAGPF